MAAKKEGASTEGSEKARVESWERDRRLADEGTSSAELPLGTTIEGASACESAKARVIRVRSCWQLAGRFHREKFSQAYVGVANIGDGL